MRLFDCPALEPPLVELTDEREAHISARHPDLLPEHLPALEKTLSDPDSIAPNAFNPDKRAFAKWFEDIRGGKFVVAQVVTDRGETDRHWIVTAYLDHVKPS